MARTLVLSGLLTLVTVEAELLTLAEAQREPLALGLAWAGLLAVMLTAVYV